MLILTGKIGSGLVVTRFLGGSQEWCVRGKGRVDRGWLCDGGMGREGLCVCVYVRTGGI